MVCERADAFITKWLLGFLEKRTQELNGKEQAHGLPVENLGETWLDWEQAAFEGPFPA